MNNSIDILKKLEGKEVYLRPTGNYARSWNGELKKTEIVKAARVFVTIEEYGREYKYRIGDFPENGVIEITNDHNSGYQIFETLEDFESYKKLDNEISFIHKFFSRGFSNRLSNFSDSDIYKIADILRDGEDK